MVRWWETPEGPSLLDHWAGSCQTGGADAPQACRRTAAALLPLLLLMVQRRASRHPRCLRQPATPAAATAGAAVSAQVTGLATLLQTLLLRPGRQRSAAPANCSCNPPLPLTLLQQLLLLLLIPHLLPLETQPRERPPTLPPALLRPPQQPASPPRPRATPLSPPGCA